MRSAIWLGLISAFFAASNIYAADEFTRLVDMLPRSANAIVLLNVEKALASPLGKFAGWEKDLEESYQAGMTRVPPQATRYVLAAEIDFNNLKPMWEAAVLDLKTSVSTKDIAKKRGGETDTIEGRAAVALPEDRYLIQFDDKTLGGMGPANRKLATTWLRDIKAGIGLSPYLKKAAGFSDNTGSEIIMAVDLDGALSLERIVAYLKKKPAVAQGDVNLQKAAKFLSAIQGVRLGIKLAQPPTAAVAIDCSIPPGIDEKLAKDALLQLLGDAGLLIEDMREWQCKVKDTEVSLQGKLSQNGLRRVMSLIDAPTLPETAAASAPPEVASPGTSTDPKKQAAQATLKHFKAVDGMFNDLKGDMKDAANLAVTATYFDRYAKRIERLPILDVDPAMLDYSSDVAASLRQAANIVRTMGIRGGARQHQVNSSSAGTSYSYGYSANWYGAGAWAVPTYDEAAELRGIDMERRAIRSEEKAIAATDVHTLRAQVADDTTKVRRAMTQKYQVEF